MKKEDIKLPWIAIGYTEFAYNGPNSLKIEVLAKAVGKNKSSFYHLFGDLQHFMTVLLNHHETQAHIIAKKESHCHNQEELITVLLEHKVDLLFNRQLRIHRENEAFSLCFEKANQITEKAIFPLWATIIDLKDNSYLSSLVYRLSLENFFLQITPKTLNKVWLNNYFTELRSLIRALMVG